MLLNENSFLFFIFCLVFQVAVESAHIQSLENVRKRQTYSNSISDIQEDINLSFNEKFQNVPSIDSFDQPNLDIDNLLNVQEISAEQDFIPTNIESNKILSNNFNSEMSTVPSIENPAANEESFFANNDSVMGSNIISTSDLEPEKGGGSSDLRDKASEEKEILLETNETNPDVAQLISYVSLAKLALCSKNGTALSKVVFEGNKILIAFAAERKNVSWTLGHYFTKYNQTKVEGLQVNKDLFEIFLPSKDPFLKLFSSLIARAKPVKVIHFVAFSMGSGVAIFSALAVRDIFPTLPKPVIYTFGGPRVGNLPFARYAMEKVRLIRATRKYDRMPRWPSWNDFLGPITYSHFGDEYWINEINGVERTFKCPPLQGQLESKSNTLSS
ncbi:hypothetical protein G9A89_014712 [Geosiphon pyriformis]|nr:hypothetical protein G9A89_014712 [Geosiphon pyriformis]